jgi:hypothetical protein
MDHLPVDTWPYWNAVSASDPITFGDAKLGKEERPSREHQLNIGRICKSPIRPRGLNWGPTAPSKVYLNEINKLHRVRAERERICANYLPYPNLQAFLTCHDGAGTIAGTNEKRKPPPIQSKRIETRLNALRTSGLVRFRNAGSPVALQVALPHRPELGGISDHNVSYRYPARILPVRCGTGKLRVGYRSALKHGCRASCGESCQLRKPIACGVACDFAELLAAGPQTC